MKPAPQSTKPSNVILAVPIPRVQYHCSIPFLPSSQVPFVHPFPLLPIHQICLSPSNSTLPAPKGVPASVESRDRGLCPSCVLIVSFQGGRSFNLQLRGLILEKPVVLFMKGTPSAPQCGFSRATVQILGIQGVDPSKFASYNVLDDPELRAGTTLFPRLLFRVQSLHEFPSRLYARIPFPSSIRSFPLSLILSLSGLDIVVSLSGCAVDN